VLEWRVLTAAAAAFGLAFGAPGCGDDQAADNEVPGEVLNVYVSVPLEGARAPDGQAIVNGAKLALADSGGEAGGWEVHANFLDDTAGRPARWDAATVADNARRAAQDTGAIAYIGEVDSGATRISVPITNQARILQVTPAATAVDLTKSGPGVPAGEPDRFYPSGVRTFGRVVPADDVQARAAAVWAKRLGARRIRVVDDGSGFGRGLAADFSGEAASRGLSASPRTGNVDAVYLAGTFDGSRPPAAGGGRVFTSDAALDPGFAPRLTAPLLATSPVVPADRLGSRALRFRRAYRRQFGGTPGPYAAYGYEAMAIVLDSIERASNPRDRTQVTKAFLATRGRRSLVGTYSIDPESGDTSLGRVAGYRVSRGRPAFERVLTVP
jgi:branched-chain amino acid transport system substrate-binding protein